MTHATRRRPDEINRRARALRHRDNTAEALLWDELKAKRLGGHKFVRQMPLGPYFADFACRTAKLVVELDGSQHTDSDYDRQRDEFMPGQGYSVLRFSSADAVKARASICSTILAALAAQLNVDVAVADLRFVLARLEAGDVL
jgi:very-short-patch-repair endonuclease